MKTFLIIFILFIRTAGSNPNTAETKAILFDNLNQVAEKIYEIEKTKDVDIEILKITRQYQAIIDIYSDEPIPVGTIVQTVEEITNIPKLELKEAVVK